MAITVVQLGAPREPNEGLRLGTVRRPPRGVPKSKFAKLDYYDVWLPNLSPSQELVTVALQSRNGPEGISSEDSGAETAGCVESSAVFVALASTNFA